MDLIYEIRMDQPAYFIADAYYASGKTVTKLAYTLKLRPFS
ncbi:MAG: hypothetical protein V1793_15990 [Pseudomonadota bacterium]